MIIITDGVVNDMVQTRDLIVASSELPMSIIMIGVGNAHFGPMEIFEGTKSLVTTVDGERAKRHIVKFVPFKNFKMVSDNF